MNAANQIALKVNEEGLMKGLQHAFTSKTTLMKELMQNADRAGANQIVIAIEEETGGALKVTIEDDGCGISDMGLLLSVAESGWSEEVVNERLPYGLGFLSALYATEAIEVESRGFRVSFDSKAALGFQPVLVEQHPESAAKPGTRLVLHGLKLKLLDARSAIHGFSVGFPVKVILDGEDVPRIHALDAPGREFLKTSIGMVSIPGFETGVTRVRTTYYLQGFKVYSAHGYDSSETSVVVHLDPAQFVARMPDRDVLVNERDRVNEVDLVMHAMWREVLARKKSELPAPEFLDRYAEAIGLYSREIMNDIPLLPRHVVEQFNEQPFQSHDWDSFRSNPVEHVPMEDVLNGKVLLVELDDVSDENAIAAWNHAWARDAMVVNVLALDKNHWVRPYVLSVDTESTEVIVRGQYAEGEVNGHYVWGMKVVLCDSFEIRVRDEGETRSDNVVIDNAIVYDGLQFLVPRQAEVSGWAVQQACDYMDENDRHEEDEMTSDSNALQRKIHELRGLPPAEVLEGLIREHYFSLKDYPSLFGRSFVLAVNAEGQYTASEQVTVQ